MLSCAARSNAAVLPSKTFDPAFKAVNSNRPHPLLQLLPFSAPCTNCPTFPLPRPPPDTHTHTHRAEVPKTDDLPRPRSLSPRRNPVPPSVRGSALSARLQRASIVRASNAPPAPPPPQTRARFSAKRGEVDAVSTGGGGGGAADADGGTDAGAPARAAAPTPSGGVEEPLTPTPRSGGGGGGSRVAALAMAIESQRQQQREHPQDDETPVMTLPAVITAAQAAGLAAEKRMKDSRHQPQPAREEPLPAAGAAAVGVGMGVKRVGRVRGRGVAAAAPQQGLVGSCSEACSSDTGTAAPFYGTGKSQIQASPQYWVPRKLSRSPVNKTKSASYSPARSTRPLW